MEQGWTLLIALRSGGAVDAVCGVPASTNFPDWPREAGLRAAVVEYK